MKEVANIIIGFALICCFYNISLADESNFDVNGSNTTYHSIGSEPVQNNAGKGKNNSLIERVKDKIKKKFKPTTPLNLGGVRG